MERWRCAGSASTRWAPPSKRKKAAVAWAAASASRAGDEIRGGGGGGGGGRAPLRNASPRDSRPFRDPVRGREGSLLVRPQCPPVERCERAHAGDEERRPGPEPPPRRDVRARVELGPRREAPGRGEALCRRSDLRERTRLAGEPALRGVAGLHVERERRGGSGFHHDGAVQRHDDGRATRPVHVIPREAHARRRRRAGEARRGGGVAEGVPPSAPRVRVVHARQTREVAIGPCPRTG